MPLTPVNIDMRLVTHFLAKSGLSSSSAVLALTKDNVFTAEVEVSPSSVSSPSSKLVTGSPVGVGIFSLSSLCDNNDFLRPEARMFWRGVGVIISIDSFLMNLEEIVLGVTVMAEYAGESGDPGMNSSSSCTLGSGLKCLCRGEYVGLCCTRGDRTFEAAWVIESRAFHPVVARALGVCCGRFVLPLDGVAD